jgi:hypothetical protein
VPATASTTSELGVLLQMRLSLSNFFIISSLAAAVASSGSCMAKFFYSQNKLKRAAQSLKASFQSRKKTQTDFLSPDPCMDVLIVR